MPLLEVSQDFTLCGLGNVVPHCAFALYYCSKYSMCSRRRRSVQNQARGLKCKVGHLIINAYDDSSGSFFKMESIKPIFLPMVPSSFAHFPAENVKWQLRNSSAGNGLFFPAFAKIGLKWLKTTKLDHCHFCKRSKHLSVAAFSTSVRQYFPNSCSFCILNENQTKIENRHLLMNFSPCFLLFFRREMGHFSNFSVENSKPRKCATLVLPSIIIMEMIRLIVMYLYNRFTVNWGGQICKDFNTIKSLHFHKCSDLYL